MRVLAPRTILVPSPGAPGPYGRRSWAPSPGALGLGLVPRTILLPALVPQDRPRALGRKGRGGRIRKKGNHGKKRRELDASPVSRFHSGAQDRPGSSPGRPILGALGREGREGMGKEGKGRGRKVNEVNGREREGKEAKGREMKGKEAK